MQKLFVVLEYGCRYDDDVDVFAAFTDKARAEHVLEIYCNNGQVQECALDPPDPHPDGYEPHRVALHADGREVKLDEQDSYYPPKGIGTVQCRVERRGKDRRFPKGDRRRSCLTRDEFM